MLHKDHSGYSVENSLEGECVALDQLEGHCSSAMQCNGKLTAGHRSCRITENNLLDLGDILAMKSPGLRVDWV